MLAVRRGVVVLLGFLISPGPALAQIDPSKRQLFAGGYTVSLEGNPPLAGYGF